MMGPVVPGEGSLSVQMYDLVPLPIWGTALMPFTFTDPSALFRARRNSRKDILATSGL